MKVQIVPAILPRAIEEWQEKTRKIQSLVSRAQVDIIDNKFADNKTIDLSDIKPLPRLKLDVQLMVEEPIHWLEKCKKIGASLVIGQIEMMQGQLEFVEKAKMGKIKVGLGLDLDTEVEKLNKEALSRADHVLLMSVKAGFSGQEFDSRVLDKIKRLRSMVGENLEISIDGGINEYNIKQIVEAGADVLCIGNALWSAPDLKSKIQQFRELVE